MTNKVSLFSNQDATQLNVIGTAVDIDTRFHSLYAELITSADFMLNEFNIHLQIAPNINFPGNWSDYYLITPPNTNGMLVTYTNLGILNLLPAIRGVINSGGAGASAGKVSLNLYID